MATQEFEMAVQRMSPMLVVLQASGKCLLRHPPNSSLRSFLSSRSIQEETTALEAECLPKAVGQSEGTGIRAQVCMTQDPTLLEAVWAEQKDLAHYFY